MPLLGRDERRRSLIILCNRTGRVHRLDTDCFVSPLYIYCLFLFEGHEFFHFRLLLLTLNLDLIFVFTALQLLMQASSLLINTLEIVWFSLQSFFEVIVIYLNQVLLALQVLLNVGHRGLTTSLN